MVELGVIEWEKHKPTWGEIPQARQDHFSFVHDKKMFVIGGRASTGALRSTANIIAYLDLTTWTWNRQDCSGAAPMAEITHKFCYYDAVSNNVKCILGPHWESSSYLVVITHTLDLSTWVWKKASHRGPWNANSQVDAVAYLPASNKMVLADRRPNSNFSDELVAGLYHLNSDRNTWCSWYDFGFAEKDSLIYAAAVTGDDQVTMLSYSPSQCVEKFTTYASGNATMATIVASGTIERPGAGEATRVVAAGSHLFYFDTRILCCDRIYVSSFQNFQISNEVAAEAKFIKSNSYAPQRPRTGASIVYYDGYLIFFGGADDDKHFNDTHVLSIAQHQQIESFLDSLETTNSSSNSTADPLGTTVDGVTEFNGKKKTKREKKKDLPTSSTSSSSADAIAQTINDGTAEGENGPIDEIKSDSSSSLPNADTSKSTSDSTAKDAITDTKAQADLPTGPTTPEEIMTSWLAAHQNNTTKLLEFAVNNPDCYPDMAFKVEGRILWAHKAIIAARSSRWRQLLDPQDKSKLSSPSTGRRGGSSDFDDSELDVSNESAMPKDRGSPSPFMFGKLGSSAIDLMLEEEDSRLKFEMIPLPLRFSKFFDHPLFSHKKPSSFFNYESLLDTSSSSIGKPNMSSDSISSSVSSSGIAPPANSVPVYTIEDLTYEAFEKVLKYMYTGSISVMASESEAISDVAHEFLLDDVSAICREKLSKSWTESPLKTARLLRRLVGSPSGSDYFFVVRHKKLFAHRFAIFLFSPHFRKLMLSRAKKAYVEVHEVEDLDLPIEVFIDFCRMLYCNFTSLPEHAEKKMDAISLTKLAKEWQEYRCTSLIKLTKPDVSLTLDLYRLAQTRPELLRDVRRTIITHFSKFVQDKAALKLLTKAERKSWVQLGEQTGATWLDKLWWAHSAGDTAMLAEAASKLDKLINVENVLPVLFCAHHVGAKPLRSACMDFMSAHSTSIEDARRMQLDTPGALGKVGSLSASVNHELTTKIAGITSSAKSQQQKVKACDLCSKTFSTFGKKNNCILCHKTACSDCTKKKVSIPPIFGITKPRDICTSCVQIVQLWRDPSANQ